MAYAFHVDDDDDDMLFYEECYALKAVVKRYLGWFENAKKGIFISCH